MQGKSGVKPFNTHISHERLLEVLDYDPLTGLFRWKVSTSKRIRIGSIAGPKSNGTRGYITLFVDGKRYLQHRLAWFYVYGIWPSVLIDHKNGNSVDNRIDNLRLASDGQNQHNKKMLKVNKSGYKGVFITKSKRFQADIKMNNKRIGLGTFLTPEEAADAYDKAAIEYFGEFALTNKMIRERNLES